MAILSWKKRYKNENLLPLPELDFAAHSPQLVELPAHERIIVRVRVRGDERPTPIHLQN